MNNSTDINKNYEEYYGARDYLKVYPTEFVMRTFLQTKLPKLNMEKPKKGDKVLEV